MSRPRPTPIMHFTDISNVATVLQHGIRCDRDVQDGLLVAEAGNADIKSARRLREVPLAPFGVVADYVPFYFAPRSPMMSAISHGKVPEYGSDVSGLVYFVSTTQLLVECGLTVICTDRNARLRLADFRYEDECDELVDWDLMQATWWNNTDDEPDRREKRMAEALVPNVVPLVAIESIVVRNGDLKRQFQEIADQNSVDIPVVVRPGWYI